MSWHQMASQEHPTVSSVLCFPGITGTICQLFFFLHVVVSLFYPCPSSKHVNFLSQPLHTLKKQVTPVYCTSALSCLEILNTTIKYLCIEAVLWLIEKAVSVGVWITNANITPLIHAQTGEKLSVAFSCFMCLHELSWRLCSAWMLFAREKAEGGHLLAK